MSPEFTFVAQKWNSGYKFIAKQYGVVVWAPDVASGINDLEVRVGVVTTQLREAGINIDEIEATAHQPRSRVAFLPQLSLFFIKLIILMVLAALLLIPIVDSFSKLVDSFSKSLIPIADSFSKAIGPASPLTAPLTGPLNHPAQFIVRLGNWADEVPPQTIDEVKLAIRKIFTKIGPVVTEVRDLMASNPSPKQNGDPPTSR